MVIYGEQSSANFVLGAVVRQRMQALSGMTGRKASIGGFLSSLSNPRAEPWTGRVIETTVGVLVIVWLKREISTGIQHICLEYLVPLGILQALADGLALFIS